MNSLNIISGRVSPPASPVPTRSNSLSQLGLTVVPDTEREGSPEPSDSAIADDDDTIEGRDERISPPPPYGESAEQGDADENSPLLSSETKGTNPRVSTWHSIPRYMASTLIDSLRWVLSTLAAPGVYLIACLYDSQGNFSPLHHFRRLLGIHGDPSKPATNYNSTLDEKSLSSPNGQLDGAGQSRSRHAFASGSSSSGLSSESEAEPDRSARRHSVSRHARSKSLQDSEEIAPARRSIRIKLHSDDAARQRKHRKTQSTGARTSSKGDGEVKDLSAQLKSPTSPAGGLTKYPKMPAPPRPLIPRRQPSYINAEPVDRPHQKTLILDLDETLIHSMSKGGRMSTGHMVEVRLNTTVVGGEGTTKAGPQHPILYYVHKRPYCDDFLRRICKWYNLVIFTASVQEYADPVIDWLESERKFFSQRLYRQHCTFRHGAFIKDLSSVEPDLSKVMILDNSPLSYMFHPDNAIPIQGWISDPTDNDLLHLVPLLEGLQYVSDVRALLALRGGEDGQPTP